MLTPMRSADINHFRTCPLIGDRLHRERADPRTMKPAFGDGGRDIHFLLGFCVVVSCRSVGVVIELHFFGEYRGFPILRWVKEAETFFPFLTFLWW